MPYHVKIANSDSQDSTEKRFTTTCILAISPTGLLGAHHYYLNRFGFGLLYTFTFGIFGVGYIVDWFRFPVLLKRSNKGGTMLHNTHKHLDDAYLLWFPLGFLGFHHFYLNRRGWGLLYMYTFGFLGIGWLVDLCRMRTLVENCNTDIDERVHLTGSNIGIPNPSFNIGQYYGNLPLRTENMLVNKFYLNYMSFKIMYWNKKAKIRYRIDKISSNGSLEVDFCFLNQQYLASST